MEKLISKENRKELLIKFGAPELFIENIGKIEELQFRLEEVDGAYFYFPTISNYEILQGFNVIPIYDEGERFRAFVYNDSTEKIIYFELEQDEIYVDYGRNWELLLMDIMIEYFGDSIEKEPEIGQFRKVGDKIGFNKADKLFRLLNIPVEEYNIKLEDMKSWRIEIAKELEIQ